MSFLTRAAERRADTLRRVKRLEGVCPHSKLYWEAYCDFIDAQAGLDAAMARADRANGIWQLKVVK